MEQRAIVGFEQDEAGDWVARLDCGHGVHMRHDPPFHFRPWVFDPAGRAERIGVLLDCPKCPLEREPEGGDAACFAHLLCPSCGAPVDGSSGHWPGCPEAAA